MTGHSDLVTIRQFFDDVRLSTRSPTAFARIKTLLTLDLCLEHALNAVVRDHGTTFQTNQLGGRGDLTFDKLWDLANEVAITKGVAGGLPNAREHKTLHQARNLAQHRGVIPSTEQISASLEPVRQTLAVIYGSLYCTDFERVQAWDALENPSLREWFHDCLNALEAGSAELATAGCKLGYKMIAQCVRDSATHPHSRFQADAALISVPQEARRIVSQLQEGLEAIEAEIIAVGLGLPIADHHRFLRCGLGINVVRVMSGEARLTVTVPWHPSATDRNLDDASFMLDYLARASLMLESAYPGVFTDFTPPNRFKDESIWAHIMGRFSSEGESGEGESTP